MIKIWNRPKVEFAYNAYKAKFAGIEFILTISHNIRVLISGEFSELLPKLVYEEYTKVDLQKLFEQAVNEWVENYVKQSFEPIVLPEKRDEYSYYNSGVNAFRDQFLRQNKNIIIEEAQGE